MVAFKLASSLWVFLPAFAALHFLHPFTGPAVAHLQLATPNQYRGRVAALFVLVFNLMGMCLGPPSVPFIPDFVLGDSIDRKSVVSGKRGSGRLGFGGRRVL